MILRPGFILLALTSLLPASQVTITDTLRNADNSLSHGTCVISWPYHVTAGAVPIVAGSRAISVPSTGVLSFSTESSTDSTPAFTYTLTCQMNRGRTSLWLNVPPGGPYALSAIATATLTSPAAIVVLSQLSTTGTAKGALIVRGASSWTTLPIGSNTQVLTADSTTTTGIKWAAPSGGGGGGEHDILSTTHLDAVAASAVLGDILYANATPAWTRLPGNTAATAKVLSQTGTGSASAAPVWIDALATNTASAVVRRDASGNFAAGTITAALTGNASTATALAVNPADCSAGQYANAIAASGDLTCAQVGSAQISNVTFVTSVSGTSSEITSTGGLTPALSIASSFRITGKTATAPMKAGTVIPASCVTGDLFFKTDATPGGNIYGCTGTDTWTAQGGGGGGGGSHYLLSVTHPDTNPAAAVLGDTLYANASPFWTRLAGNITTTKKFLNQTGTGVVSAPPQWDALVDADIPDTITLTSITQITSRSHTSLTDIGAATHSTIDAHIASVAAHSATSANSANRMVLRGASGEFAAGVITASLSGNASTATALAADPTDCASYTFANAINASGTLTCSSIPNAATTATSSNVANTIVARDASGNFSAGTVSATSFVGNTGNLLSTNHPDTVAAAAVLGDLIYANVTPAWTKLAGNVTTSTKVLTQLGTGVVSAAPLWATITGGPSGGITVTHTVGDIAVDIDTAVVPRKAAANTMTGLNTFDLGVQLTPGALPGAPAAGRVFIDSGASNLLKWYNGTAWQSAGGMADPGGNGVVVRTALNTTINRTITGTASEITVTNGDGVAGNPTLSRPDIGGGTYSWWTNLKNPVPAASAAQNVGTVVKVFLVELTGKQTFSKGSVNIETASAGGNLRVGVYSMATGVCANLLFQTGNIATDATGVQSGTFTGTQLSPGFYYMAIAADNATVTARGYPSGTAFNDLLNAGTLKYIGTATNTATFPTPGLPSTCGGMTAATQTMPGMVFSQ